MTLVQCVPPLTFATLSKLVDAGQCWTDADLQITSQIITLTRLVGSRAASRACWLLMAAAPDMLAVGRGLLLSGRLSRDGRELLEQALAQAVRLSGPLGLVPYSATDHDLYAEEWCVYPDMLTEMRKKALCLLSEALAAGHKLELLDDPGVGRAVMLCEVGIRARKSPLAWALAQQTPPEVRE